MCTDFGYLVLNDPWFLAGIIFFCRSLSGRVSLGF